MLHKTQWMFSLFFGFLFLLFGEFIYLKVNAKNSDSLGLKKNFVSMSSLADLAIYNEDTYLRHRSLLGVGEIYSVDGVLREYDKGSFVIGRGDVDE